MRRPACFSSCSMARSMIGHPAVGHLDAVDEEGRRRPDAQEPAQRGIALHVGEDLRVLGIEVGDAADVPDRLLQAVQRQRQLVGEQPVLEGLGLAGLAGHADGRGGLAGDGRGRCSGCWRCTPASSGIVLGHELHLARRLLVPLGLERLEGLEGGAAGRALVVVELDDHRPPRRRRRPGSCAGWRCSCSRRAATTAAAPPRPAAAPRTRAPRLPPRTRGSAAARGNSARSAIAAATKPAPRARAAGRASSALEVAGEHGREGRRTGIES